MRGGRQSLKLESVWKIQHSFLAVSLPNQTGFCLEKLTEYKVAVVDGVMELDGGMRSGRQPLKRRPVPLVASPPPLSPSCEALLRLWDFFVLYLR